MSPLDKLNFFSNDIDWVTMNEELESIDWVFELSNINPDDMLKKFITKVEAICNKYG